MSADAPDLQYQSVTVSFGETFPNSQAQGPDSTAQRDACRRLTEPRKVRLSVSVGERRKSRASVCQVAQLEQSPTVYRPSFVRPSRTTFSVTTYFLAGPPASTRQRDELTPRQRAHVVKKNYLSQGPQADRRASSVLISRARVGGAKVWLNGEIQEEGSWLIRQKIGVHTPRKETGRGGWRSLETGRLTKVRQEGRKDLCKLAFGQSRPSPQNREKDSIAPTLGLPFSHAAPRSFPSNTSHGGGKRDFWMRSEGTRRPDGCRTSVGTLPNNISPRKGLEGRYNDLQQRCHTYLQSVFPPATVPPLAHPMHSLRYCYKRRGAALLTRWA